MYDMHSNGAIAFSDGIVAVQSAGLQLKALQYVKAFNGILIQLPGDKSIGSFGLMNEGIVSTQLGLPGIPALAEELMVERDIKLAAYTESKIHFTGISTAKSLAIIQQAKQQGLQVSCSVTPQHLFYCDEDLAGYDTNLKINPPLRKREDMLALRQALKDGAIDCIASHHAPQDWDSKNCEFEYAKPGMISLQTAFACIHTIVPGLTPQSIANLFSQHARKIFSLPPAAIQEGAEAEFTLFTQSGNTIFYAGK